MVKQVCQEHVSLTNSLLRRGRGKGDPQNLRQEPVGKAFIPQQVSRAWPVLTPSKRCSFIGLGETKMGSCTQLAVARRPEEGHQRTLRCWVRAVPPAPRLCWRQSRTVGLLLLTQALQATSYSQGCARQTSVLYYHRCCQYPSLMGTALFAQENQNKSDEILAELDETWKASPPKEPEHNKGFIKQLQAEFNHFGFIDSYSLIWYAYREVTGILRFSKLHRWINTFNRWH